MPFSISSQLSKTLDIARLSDLPVLLIGAHGIGKSEFLTNYAYQQGLELTILDLSLLEPTDLTGIPVILENKTHYASPALLPDSQSTKPHMLVLEELNRCPLAMRQPCLQLLTARHLNEYTLPKNTFLVACMNPSDEEYDVDDLDPALSSRFLTLPIKPDPRSWLTWAKENHVHPAVQTFIKGVPTAFEHIPPRTWVYLSTLLYRMHEQGWSKEESKPIIQSILGDTAWEFFYSFFTGYNASSQLVTGVDIVAEPYKFIDYIRQLRKEERMDTLLFLSKDIQHALNHHSLENREELHEVIQQFPADLFEDLYEHIYTSSQHVEVITR